MANTGSASVMDGMDRRAELFPFHSLLGNRSPRISPSSDVDVDSCEGQLVEAPNSTPGVDVPPVRVAFRLGDWLVPATSRLSPSTARLRSLLTVAG